MALDKIPRLNWRERWLASPAKATDDASVKASAETSLATSAETSARSPASSPGGSPENIPENIPVKGSHGFSPLTIVRIGDTVQIARPPDQRVEWSNTDFARLFLHWLACEPACRNGWVSVPDIEDDFFPRFQADGACQFLGVGALYRGLGAVTQKRERNYTDFTGKRCSMTEYWVPGPDAAVVELAEEKRKRA